MDNLSGLFMYKFFSRSFIKTKICLGNTKKPLSKIGRQHILHKLSHDSELACKCLLLEMLFTQLYYCKNCKIVKCVEILIMIMIFDLNSKKF